MLKIPLLILLHMLSIAWHNIDAHSHTDSHLKAICNHQSSYWHVFGNWKNTREPSWILHKHKENIWTLHRQQFELRIKPRTLQLYGCNATHSIPTSWIDLINRQSETNQRETVLLWALQLQCGDICKWVNITTSLNPVLQIYYESIFNAPFFSELSAIHWAPHNYQVRRMSSTQEIRPALRL